MLRLSNGKLEKVNRIVIFGAGGFIGQHLVRSLATIPDNQVIAFDRFSKYQNNLDNPFIEFNNVEIVSGNFFNRDDIINVLKDADYVFHLISSTNPASSSKDPFIDIDTNVRASIELFELCSEYGIKKIIFPSSGGTVYGDIDHLLIDENTSPRPRSPYGIGKITVEYYLRYFKQSTGLQYIVYRIANPYGPGQNIFGKQGVIPIFMNKFLTKEPLSIYGDGSMVRDYIYIDDLINMMVQTYMKDNVYDEYNLGSGQGHTVNELVENIEKCAGYSVQRQRLDTPSTFVHKSVLDINRFVEEFNIKPQVTLDDGIERTWQYVKKLR